MTKNEVGDYALRRALSDVDDELRRIVEQNRIRASLLEANGDRLAARHVEASTDPLVALLERRAQAAEGMRMVKAAMRPVSNFERFAQALRDSGDPVRAAAYVHSTRTDDL